MIGVIAVLDVEAFMLGMAAGGGGGGVSEEYITGTADNPWGDLDVAALSRDIATNNVSVIIECTMGDYSVRSYVYTDTNSERFVVSRAYYEDSSLSIKDAYNFAWNNASGQLIHAYATQRGVSTDLTAYATRVTTTLIVIRHPLP